MSWSLSLETVDGSPFSSDEAEAKIAEAERQCEGATELAKAALEAAYALIKTGYLGDPLSYRFRIHLNGHVNPNHEPRDSWVNDYVNVSVGQL